MAASLVAFVRPLFIVLLAASRRRRNQAPLIDAAFICLFSLISPVSGSIEFCLFEIIIISRKGALVCLFASWQTVAARACQPDSQLGRALLIVK